MFKKNPEKMVHLYKNNWVAIGLLITGILLAVISVVGYIFNPSLFSSFSWLVFGVIISIASYMLYNIKKIRDEMKHSKK
ncbi:MAG: hypothetical protein ACTSRI_05495 [Promethearchaeota archaeon]